MRKVMYNGCAYDVVASEIEQNYLDVENKLLLEKEDTDEHIWVSESEVTEIEIAEI